MVQKGHNDQVMGQGTPDNRAMSNQPTHTASVVLSEEEMAADVDEPPDLQRTPRPSALKLHDSFKASFSKRTPSNFDRKESLLTTALHSNGNSPVEEISENVALRRGMSSASSWSNNSASTAELTSDGGLTSPGTRTRTPSPPAPSSLFPNSAALFNGKSIERPVSIVKHDDDLIGPLQKPALPSSVEQQDMEAALARKRCIKFACNNVRHENPKPATEAVKAPAQAGATTEPPKRACTIKFACPTKISNNGPSMNGKPRVGRALSPAPPPRKPRPSPRPGPKLHRDSNSTVREHSPASVRKYPRTQSPVSTRKEAPAKSQARRLSISSDLERSEAYRFHEFAGSEEEEDEWLQESTCHASRLTVRDTLKIENRLRQLGEEAEEEALDEEDEEDQDDEDEDGGDDDDDDDDDLEENEDEEEEYESDEGFQTDDEEGFAGSDNESDAGSDFAWWAPGADSTAATSVDYIRPDIQRSRSNSESSIGSRHSDSNHNRSKILGKRRSRPVNIRVPSPELPDSTDFVCGTLDEDRPLEAAYMSCLERRRAAKHKLTPQDIDPTFPTSDPEMDEEDEDDDDEEEPDRTIGETHEHMMQHGQMDQLHYDGRGRSKGKAKRSPPLSPKRLRSPPPINRAGHRSPPPRKLFGHSPRRMRSPPPNTRLRSPPPSRRGSANVVHVLPRRPGMTIQFQGLAQRPAMTMSSSVPRTPVAARPPGDYEDEDTACELPMRRAIDIKIGLEKRRQRRKEQQYRKAHRKGTKDKRPAPGKGVERMREMGLGLAAHRGKNTGFAFGMPPTPDQKDMHVLSV